jgi:hypothetical protein
MIRSRSLPFNVAQVIQKTETQMLSDIKLKSLKPEQKADKVADPYGLCVSRRRALSCSGSTTATRVVERR